MAYGLLVWINHDEHLCPVYVYDDLLPRFRERWCSSSPLPSVCIQPFFCVYLSLPSCLPCRIKPQQELLELKQLYVKATGVAYGPAPKPKKGKNKATGDSQPKQMDTRKADKAKKVGFSAEPTYPYIGRLFRRLLPVVSNRKF